MDRKDVAYVINTTPKYFFLLPLHLTLLQRYAPSLQWPIFLATEEANHPDIMTLKKSFPMLTITPLTQDKEAFLESRAEGVRALPAEINYVLPMQEDFLLEGRPIEKVLKGALEILDESPSVCSMRLMPCPGPKGNESFGETSWKLLKYEVDEYVFTYQATIWRRESYQQFLDTLILGIDQEYHPLTPKQKVQVQIKMNVGECKFGQEILRRKTKLHLAWPREGKQPNAVYLCAWPYRPTAVVQGRTEDWALVLAKREDIDLPSA